MKDTDDENRITIKEVKSGFKKINDKINNLSKGKQIFLLLFLFTIFCGLIYLTSIDKIQTVEYTKHGEVLCVETYINGELNGSSCEEYYQDNNIKWNTQQQLGILENLILNLNQS